MNEDIKELVKKREKWVEASRENGFREGISDLLAHQYSKKTHFIFELLQNAEDAEASAVEFRIEDDRLECSHNGKRTFTYKDVDSITSIGKSTKRDDYTLIGKHGIGFKAVFVYTHTPIIHSGDTHFRIEDVVMPVLLDGDDRPRDLRPGETRIILPFDDEAIPEDRRFRILVPAEQARADIDKEISHLGLRTPLFLRNIKEIQWRLSDGSSGCYLRESEKIPDVENGHRVTIIDDQHTEQWLIFDRKVEVEDNGKPHDCTVQVGFLVEQGQVAKAERTDLVVWFATEKKTELGFLVQGPFKTTKARDNIERDSEANRRLIAEAAQLAADSLIVLRDLGHLDVSSYMALPLVAEDFPEDGEAASFRPFYDRIREALQSEPLLPRHGGGFVKAGDALLASPAWFAELFTADALNALLDRENLAWVDTAIRESGKYAEVFAYFKSELEVAEIDPAKLARHANAEFFESRPLDWLRDFILHAKDGAKVLKELPFIRLESGEQASITDYPWFRPRDGEKIGLSGFKLVHAELAADKEVRAFLESAGIEEVKPIDVIVEAVLPKYRSPADFDETDYRSDLKRIAETYAGCDDTGKKALKDRLNGYSPSYSWLACVRLGQDPAEAEVSWRKPKAADLYDRPENLDAVAEYLDARETYVLHPVVSKEIEEFESFAEFINRDCLNRLTELAIVKKAIVPIYQTENRVFCEEEYRKHLSLIAKAYRTGQSIEKLCEMLEDKKCRWLACVLAADPSNSGVFWKAPGDSRIFADTSDIRDWFEGWTAPNFGEEGDYLFLHPALKELPKEMIGGIVKPREVLHEHIEFTDGEVIIECRHGHHKIGLKGFDSRAMIVGLNHPDLFEHWNTDRFEILWKILLKHPKIICGQIQENTAAKRVKDSPKLTEFSQAGKILIKASWIPGSDGHFHRPGDLLLSDLPEAYDTQSVAAREVAEKLGMKKPEERRVIDALSKGDPEKEKALEGIRDASPDQLKQINKILQKETPQSKGPPSFKDDISQLSRPQRSDSVDDLPPAAPVTDPERYQGKLDERTRNAVEAGGHRPPALGFSVVRDSPSNTEAREFLYSQYQGKCQITNSTFRKADGSNYFEAVSLNSRLGVEHLNDPGNMLCLSAEMSAQFSHASFDWVDDIETKIREFKAKNEGGSIEHRQIRICLAGEERVITWSEKHFMRLKSLWNHA